MRCFSCTVRTWMARCALDTKLLPHSAHARRWPVGLAASAGGLAAGLRVAGGSSAIGGGGGRTPPDEASCIISADGDGSCTRGERMCVGGRACSGLCGQEDGRTTWRATREER